MREVFGRHSRARIVDALDFPDGFCTVTCVDDRDCPSDALCADTHGGVCVFGCRDNRDCDFLGPRYTCREKKDFANLSVLVCMGG